MKLTLSVRSFQVPATPGTCAWPPSLPSVPTSRATRVTSEANALSWSTIVLMVFLSSRISPFTSTVILRERSPRATAVVTSAMLRTCAVELAGEVAAGDGGGDFSNVADLAGQVAGHGVDGVGEILPGTSDAGNLRLA